MHDPYVPPASSVGATTMSRRRFLVASTALSFLLTQALVFAIDWAFPTFLLNFWTWLVIVVASLAGALAMAPLRDRRRGLAFVGAQFLALLFLGAFAWFVYSLA